MIKTRVRKTMISLQAELHKSPLVAQLQLGKCIFRQLIHRNYIRAKNLNTNHVGGGGCGASVG